jgi:hypothetical protein
VSKRDKEIEALMAALVYGAGCPKLSARAHYDKKHDTVVLRLSQTDKSAAGGRRHPLFVGAITVRVQETGGTYDHVVAVTEPTHEYAAPWHIERGADREGERVRDARTHTHIHTRTRSLKAYTFADGQCGAVARCGPRGDLWSCVWA